MPEVPIVRFPALSSAFQLPVVLLSNFTWTIKFLVKSAFPSCFSWCWSNAKFQTSARFKFMSLQLLSLFPFPCLFFLFSSIYRRNFSFTSSHFVLSAPLFLLSSALVFVLLSASPYLFTCDSWDGRIMVETDAFSRLENSKSW